MFFGCHSLSGVCLTRNRRHGARRASVSDPGFVGGEVRAASAEAAATVKYVDPEAAKELVTKEGYTIVDIRDESQYKRSHIASSVHVPLFIENTDSDIGKGFSFFSPTQISWNLYQILTLVALLQPHAWSLQMMFVTAKSKIDRKLLRICVSVCFWVGCGTSATLLRKQMHMSFAGTFYGVAFTKTNPDFVATFEKQFQKDSKILIVCQEGLRSEDHIPDILFTVSLCKHLGMSEFFQCFSFPPSSLDLQEKSFNPWFLAFPMERFS